jgi:hypothetical protein
LVMVPTSFDSASNASRFSFDTRPFPKSLMHYAPYCSAHAPFPIRLPQRRLLRTRSSTKYPLPLSSRYPNRCSSMTQTSSFRRSIASRSSGLATADEFRDAARSFSVGGGAKTWGRERFQRARPHLRDLVSAPTTLQKLGPCSRVPKIPESLLFWPVPLLRPARPIAQSQRVPPKFRPKKT